MKTSLRLIFALAAAVLSVRLAAEPTVADQPHSSDLTGRLAPQSFSKNPQLDMIVVAETTAENVKLVRPTPEQPAYYVTFDDGYRETGDPVANEKPPTSAEVARALRQTLAAEGYQPATDQMPPALLLIYQWGVLHQDSLASRNSMEIDPNLKARLALVAGKKYARQIEDEILQRRMSRELHTNFPPPVFLNIREQELLQLAQDDHYFVIVSAYDYAALRRHETRLLWRTRLSTRTPGVAMSPALPALIQGGGPYFGRNADEPQFIRSPLEPVGKLQTGAPAGPPAPEAIGAAGRLDDPFVRELAEKEGAEVTGDRWRATSGGRAQPPSGPAATSD